MTAGREEFSAFEQRLSDAARETLERSIAARTRGRVATERDVARIWEEHEQLVARGDHAGAADARDVAMRRERWLDEHPGYDRPPCGRCSQEGTVPFDRPELGTIVWLCAHHAADEHAREAAAAEPEFEGHAYARHLEGHVHTRVFVGPKGRTRARAGVLITREGPETDWLLLALECGGLEVTHERTEG
jgi:hypothetical protein